MTLVFEQEREHLAHRRVILDDQDCAAPVCAFRCLWRDVPRLADGRAGTAPADIGTSLHFLGADETVDLVNWGYSASDQALRAWYEPAVVAGKGVPLRAGAK